MTTSTPSETTAKKDVTKLQRAIVDGLEDVKAQDIQVFNTEHLSPLFERVIVASGTSNRQTKALASSVRDAVRDAGFAKPRIEGEENGEWIIVDCGAAVVHIMQPTIRQYYRLEELWGEKPVRLKLGAAKPAAPEAKVPVKTAARRAAKAQAEAEGTSVAAKPARKSPAKKTVAATTPAKAPAKTAVKTTVKSAPKAAGKAAAADVATKKPVKTLVVKPRTATKPAAKKTSKPAAKAAAPAEATKAPRKTPARKPKAA